MAHDYLPSSIAVSVRAGMLAAVVLLCAVSAKASSPSSATYFKGTGDQYDITSGRAQLQLTVNVTGSLPTFGAVITVYGYDVDEEQGEIDNVYFNGHLLGHMSGANNVWNATTFVLDPSWVISGTNQIIYDIDVNNAGWSSRVDWVQLLIDGGSGELAYIENISVASWSIVSTNVELHVNIDVVGVQAGTYRIENNLIDPSQNNVGSQTDTFTLAAGEHKTRPYTFAYPSSSPSGQYTLNANLFQSSTLLQQAYEPFHFRHTSGGGPNLPPVISLIGDKSTLRDHAIAIPFTISDAEEAVGSLTLSTATSIPGVIAPSGLAITGTGGSRLLTVTPVNGATGQSFVTIQVSDGLSTAERSFFVDVVDPTNHAPVLSSAATPIFSAIVQDTSDYGGNSLAEVIIDGSITDVDGVAAEAVALIDADSTHGVWQVSYDDGATWAPVPVVAIEAALLLGAGDRLRFIPTAGYVGTATVGFVAWDMTTGSRGSIADVAVRGADNAFSSASDSASITVRSSASGNSAPVLDVTATPKLSPVASGNLDAPGNTVAEIVVDGSITDVDGPAAEAIAVTAVDTTCGSWEFSTDDGVSWTTLSGVTGSAARLLGPTHRIHFVPNVGCSAATITFCAWDRSSGTPGGVADVGVSGGNTAFSVAADTAAIGVGAANHAPILDASAAHALTPILEDNITSGGNTVAEIIVNGSITDQDPPALEAIAVIGSDETNGAWQVSFDSGVSWSTMGARSAASALLLLSTHRVRFVPAAEFYGTASFQFVAWDTYTGTAGDTVDASSRGAATTFSTASDDVAIVIKESDDPPQLVPPTPSSTISVDDGSQVSFGLAATDIDTPSLDYEVTPLPTGAAFVGATFTWTPSWTQGGNTQLTLSVSDAHSTVQRSLTVSVTVRDSDSDGLPDGYELEHGLSPTDNDSDHDGILDPVEVGLGTPGSPSNTDGTDAIDALDDDSDNDGLDDSVEAPGGTLVDTDSDGTPDFRDTDSDNDGVSDGVDHCRVGELGWTSSQATDDDGDGCRDAGEDTDDDDDGVLDGADACAAGETGWLAGAANDRDSDGCRDASEDTDDDNDGVADGSDVCAAGSTSWTSTSGTDHDSDGCQDSGEDTDDDNDGVGDSADACAVGATGWTSAAATDHDGDGCQDAGEDTDDDEDGVLDTVDTCSSGDLGWAADVITDHDADGCRDAGEDLDDDNDGIGDGIDVCFAGEIGWASDGTTDHDGDGCRDGGEDLDDDDDGLADSVDVCARGDLAWTSTLATDYDGDGCQDAVEDLDDDNDAVSDAADLCVTGDVAWTSDGVTDHDGDGCQDVIEDTDDDNDGLADGADACLAGDLGWTSDVTTDHDGDGCQDAAEDTDDDDDGTVDSADACQRGELGWTAGPTTDHDGDGCQDAIEDTDDDNDGVTDSVDACVSGDLSWTSSASTDFDGDGCRDAGEDTDDDDDGSPDSTDALPHDAGEHEDTDGDGIGDASDTDDDGDGISDVAEVALGTDPSSTDSDGDGIADGVELERGTNPLSDDSDGDGIPDDIEVPFGEPVDTDGDGILDAMDVDADNDGMADVDEAGFDNDGDGLPDQIDFDDDNDGIDSSFEVAQQALFGLDIDGDGTFNYLDVDADGDGTPDAIEGAGDADGDGIPNYLDASGREFVLGGGGCSASDGSPAQLAWALLPVLALLRSRSRRSGLVN